VRGLLEVRERDSNEVIKIAKAGDLSPNLKP
jgi:hypothetical protein